MTNIFTNNTAQKVHDLVNDLSQCGKNLTHKLSAAEEKARNLEAEVNRLDVQVRRLRDAIILVSTMKPSMAVDDEDPIGTVQEVIDHLNEEAKRLGFGSFDFNKPKPSDKNEDDEEENLPAVPAKKKPNPYSTDRAVLIKLTHKLSIISDPNSEEGIYSSDSSKFFANLLQELTR